MRKNIALKLRDQGPPPASNKEGGEIGELDTLLMVQGVMC